MICACLALIAASMGVFNQDIYSKVVGSEWLPGTVSQDAVTLIAGLLLLFLSLKLSESDRKKQIIALSLLAYLFYAYGIYVIEQLYNSFYLLYILIFALSFWSLVYGLLNIRQEAKQQVQLSKSLRAVSAGCLVFIALLFLSLWIAQLIPLMRSGHKIEFTYSIFILDLAFVLPALLITAVMILKQNGLGLIFAPILFVKAFTLLFSVGLGGLIRPCFKQSANPGETGFYLVLSGIFLALAVLHLSNIRFQRAKD